MKRFRVKVCGITRPVDAIRAAELGADMIGMIFVKHSPRYLTLKKAQLIARALPQVVQPVGVFVDEPVDSILRLADKLRLTFVQLCGSETNATVERIRREGYRVVKAFPMRDKADWGAVKRSAADLVMVDNVTERGLGGSGKTFDWSFRPPRRIDNLVLAGGLNEKNLAEGVRRFDPLVVDVNSGVEVRPGIKSHEKLRRFFRKCDQLRHGR